jgi:hypothetical protein
MTQCEYRDLTGGRCRAGGKACTVARIGLPSRTVALCKHHEGKLSHTVTDQAINRIPEKKTVLVSETGLKLASAITRSKRIRARASWLRGRDTSL